MGKEIERKFLVKGNSWRNNTKGSYYRQGYLILNAICTVRVRTAGDKGFLTIKGPPSGLTRHEYEYSIPVDDANEILQSLCKKPIIEKVRYTLRYRGVTWEIDEFAGENEGLILAEVELHDDCQRIELPNWVGKEVSGHVKYYNASLVRHPFKRWSDGD